MITQSHFKCRATDDYQATDVNELALKQGQVYTIIQVNYSNIHTAYYSMNY